MKALAILGVSVAVLVVWLFASILSVAPAVEPASELTSNNSGQVFQQQKSVPRTGTAETSLTIANSAVETTLTIAE